MSFDPAVRPFFATVASHGAIGAPGVTTTAGELVDLEWETFQ